MRMAQRKVRLQTAIALFGLLLAACTVASEAQGGTWRSTRGTPDTMTSVPPQAGGVTPGAQAALDLGVPAKVERGRVTISLSNLSYSVGSTIRATIANGLERTVYALDSKTDCSIAILERWDGKGWQAISGCALGRPPSVIMIGPGRGRVVTINPRSLHLGVGTETSTPAFGAGRYRITFTYGFNPESADPEPHASHSPTFRIAP